MRVSLISTEGPWLMATISTPFGIFYVMDAFTSEEPSTPYVGGEFEVELSASLLDDSEPWETIFSGNKDRLKSLENVDGWCYRAFGEVVSINPVVVDCGLMQIEDVIHSKDARIVGEFISFTITRLQATEVSEDTGLDTNQI